MFSYHKVFSSFLFLWWILETWSCYGQKFLCIFLQTLGHMFEQNKSLQNNNPTFRPSIRLNLILFLRRKESFFTFKSLAGTTEFNYSKSSSKKNKGITSYRLQLMEKNNLGAWVWYWMRAYKFGNCIQRSTYQLRSRGWSSWCVLLPPILALIHVLQVISGLRF